MTAVPINRPLEDVLQPFLVLAPCVQEFELGEIQEIREGTWRVSRFTYQHYDEGECVARSPRADCFVKIRSDVAAALLQAFYRPVEVAGLIDRFDADLPTPLLCGALARAQIILPCDERGETIDETDPKRRPWEFHDLLFHSRSRLGRMEKEFGGTYRLREELPSPPAVKEHPWTETVVPLPRANLDHLTFADLPLTAAIEHRRSNRNHSLVPLGKQEIGEFFYRVARVRRRFQTESGDFTSRPYPGGGALYESEFYLTINSCLDIPRGFYYYDPVAHSLCLVCGPGPQVDGVLLDAWRSMAQVCVPQLVVTIASRFPRFHWKYAGMSYAAQMKNVGVIYQTMYLVATSMNLAACGLGIGDAKRFADITGLDELEEGSIGEFALGRPA